MNEAEVRVTRNGLPHFFCFNAPESPESLTALLCGIVTNKDDPM